MPVNLIGLGPYRPGGSAYGASLAEAKNVLPYLSGYYPLRGLTASVSFGSGSLLSPSVADIPIRGCYVHFFPANAGSATYIGDAQTFHAGTRQNLYVFPPGAGAPTNVSRGGGYAVAVGASPGFWRYASFGNDVWTANGLDIFQRRTNNAGNFADGPVSTFVPRPRFCGVVREFMVALDLVANGVGFDSDQFTWSDINDATWWDDRTGARPASLSGGSVGKRIRSRPGQITGFVGGEYGTIFKRGSIYALQLVGGADVWRLDEVDPGVGNMLPSSLIAARRGNYFYGGDGFYRQQGLSPAEKISPPEIDVLFTDNYQNARRALVAAVTPMAAEDDAMIGFESRRTGMLGWIVRNSDLGTASTMVFFYNPALETWTYAELPFVVTGACSRPAMPRAFLSHDMLDVLFYATISGTDSKFMTFSSSPMAATLKTQRALVPGAEAGSPGEVIRAVSVLTTSPQTNGTTQQLAPSVTPLTATVTAGNDPLFAGQADADGAAVSPRTGIGSTAANLNDWGELAVAVQGAFFDLQIDIDAGTEWTAIEGFYLRTAAGSAGR